MPPVTVTVHRKTVVEFDTPESLAELEVTVAQVLLQVENKWKSIPGGYSQLATESTTDISPQGGTRWSVYLKTLTSARTSQSQEAYEADFDAYVVDVAADAVAWLKANTLWTNIEFHYKLSNHTWQAPVT